MARPNPLVVAIHERIDRKQLELASVTTEIAELTVKREAIVCGIKDDRDLLTQARPKMSRQKKSREQPDSTTPAEG